jgi:hypothetical protein
MQSRLFIGIILCGLVCLAKWTAVAQEAAPANAAVSIAGAVPSSGVPNMINYSGMLKDASGRVLTSVTGVTFLLYQDEQGGAPLWMETQNVTPDKSGHYTVMLGATTSSGVPADLFVAGAARWLGVQVAGQAEQARVLLVAVPYAMKAADAETIGGLPPSAFVLAAPPTSSTVSAATTNTTSNASPSTTSDVTTTGGTVNALPLWTTGTNIQSSGLVQTGSGSTAKFGIGTTAPAVTLDVRGTVHGAFTLPATGTATAAGGKDSQQLGFQGSVFNSSTSTAVAQNFVLQAEPFDNDTSTASGTLNLLYASGTATPAETGVKISSTGIFTFATGQTFPGTGTGTITGVTAGTDLTGGGTTGTVTLNLNTTKVPLLASANTFTASQTVDGSLTSTGTITAANVTASATVTASTLDATNAAVSNTFNMSNAVDVPLQVISSNAAATSIYGEATNTTGAAWGVEGETDSSDSRAYGVIGYASASSGDPIGVYGWVPATPDGIGVRGQLESESEAGSSFTGAGGVWGDGGIDTGQAGVVGTVDDGNAGIFINNSSTGYYTLYVDSETAASDPFAAYGANGRCVIDSSGDLGCSGTVTGSAVLDDGTRTVAMSAIESPQNWFEDAGEAEMVNGAAVVHLDSTYTQTVNTEMKYQVFLTPYDDCKGLYVTNRTANSFEVHELGGGTANLSFGYRIMALRRKYENVRFADHTHDLDGMKLIQKRAQAPRLPQSHNPGKIVRPAAAAPAKTAQMNPVAATAR